MEEEKTLEELEDEYKALLRERINETKTAMSRLQTSNPRHATN